MLMTAMADRLPVTSPAVAPPAGAVAARSGLVGRVMRVLALDPRDLGPSLLAIMLRTSLVLGALVYVPSVVLAVTHDLYLVVVIDTVALGGVIALYLGSQLSFRARAAWFCLIYFILGAGLLLAIGSLSQIYLFGFSLITTLLLGIRIGLVSVALCAVALLAVLLSGNFANAGELGAAGGVAISLNFALVDTLLTIVIGAVVAAVQVALEREIGARLALEQERNVLRTLIDTLPDAVFTMDTDGRFTSGNRAALTLFGVEREDELPGKTVHDLHPPDLAERLHADDLSVMAGATILNREERAEDGEGKPRWHLTIKVPLRAASGEVVGLLGVARDITDRKQAEADRHKLEEQLRQTQKMEAIGQLAGGIAHDFNNLLSVILGYAGFLLDDMTADDPARSDIVEIREAGARATELTRQLLMFSRKQTIQPAVLDLNAMLANVDRMLHRVVGEDIEVAIVAGRSLGHVLADRGSLEQVVMNLVVNARDAMPTGGRLTLETANVELDEIHARTHLGATPGPHVMLSVTDSGTGMDKATLARIYEPFFTTKATGKGTGLGLSTVFGIVQQCHGSIWVYSEVGHGTTFKIYLPRVDATAAATTAPAVASAQRAGETILLVEDEAQVRDVATEILVRRGYRVLVARHPGEAMQLSQDHDGPIHVLLSDIVMPQMSGPELAKRLAPMRPDMHIVLMSGYTDDAAVRHGVCVAEVAYVQKPFTAESLTAKVRGVLDARA